MLRGRILVDHYNFIHSFLRWVAMVTIIPLFSVRYVLRQSGTFATVAGYFVCAASNGIRVTRLRAGRSALEFLPIARDFSVLRNIQTGSGSHPASYYIGTRFVSRA